MKMRIAKTDGWFIEPVIPSFVIPELARGFSRQQITQQRLTVLCRLNKKHPVSTSNAAYPGTPVHTSAAQHFSQNHIQNILGKVDNHTAEKGHEALRTLAGIVAFEGKTDLHNAEA